MFLGEKKVLFTLPAKEKNGKFKQVWFNVAL
jgi:hypothetical protein